MSGSIFGNLFKVSTWGESHGKALGVVIDGCPSGINLCEDDIQKELDKRKPGNKEFATKRKENDSVEILSGVFEGLTTGTPISLIVYNNDQRSKDYNDICNLYRPGHADYCYDKKYGFRDYRGGGRSSGRETVSRVAGGAIAKKILNELDINIDAYTISIGDIAINRNNFSYEEIKNNELSIPDKQAYKKARTYLDSVIKENDSSGGIIECIIRGVNAGIGEPVFDKLDAKLAEAMLSIGGVKGIEFGIGFESGKIKGSDNNDEFYADENNTIRKYTNNSGGILGGISDGSDIVFRLPFKPTPSISKKQHTVSKSGENIEINIKGRHDPIIISRAIVVVESMVAITLVDMIFMNILSRIDNIKKIYQ